MSNVIMIDSFYDHLSPEEREAIKKKHEAKSQPGEPSAAMKVYLESKNKQAQQTAAMPGVSEGMKKYLSQKK